MRIALGIEYVGTNYSGWQGQQNQEHVNCVQTTLEKALAKVADHPVAVVGAGRTDAGVHACGQVVHCDVNAVRDPHAWVFGSNTHLPEDIRVLWMHKVADDFDARRSALSRHYTYIIYNSRIRPSLLRDYVGWYYSPLDETQMLAAAKFWLGEHDFSSFRGAGCQSKSARRYVQMIDIVRRGDMVIVDIIADAFLYHMVRNMVGVLLEIGSAKRAPIWALDVLRAQCRTKAGITASASGLYLREVTYPSHCNIPRTKQNLWFLDQD